MAGLLELVPLLISLWISILWLADFETLTMASLNSGENCTDLSPSCPDLKTNHTCFVDAKNMFCTCPETCNTPSCNNSEDELCECVGLAQEQSCERNSTIRNSMCKTTCDTRQNATLCSSPPQYNGTKVDMNNATGKLYDVIGYTCNLGYKPAQDLDCIHVCLNGTWLPATSLPCCELIRCGRPADVTNTNVSYQSDVFGSVATYYCISDSDVTQKVTCLANSSWSVADIVCQPKHCPGITQIKNGQFVDYKPTVSGGEFNPGDFFTYKCNFDYVAENGVGILVCGSNGEWSGSDTNCKRKVCDSGAPDVPNSTKNVNTTAGYANQVVKYSCNDGLVQSGGEDEKVCSSSGQWEGKDITCSERVCGSPPSFLHSEVRPSVTGGYLNQTIVYSCLPGYTSETGEKTKTCTSNATWEGQEDIVCVPVTCTSPPYPPYTNRTFINSSPDSKVFAYLTTVHYECYPNFTAVSGNQSRICNSTGHWDGENLVCSNISSVYDTVTNDTATEDQTTSALTTLTTQNPTTATADTTTTSTVPPISASAATSSAELTTTSTTSPTSATLSTTTSSTTTTSSSSSTSSTTTTTSSSTSTTTSTTSSSSSPSPPPSTTAASTTTSGAFSPPILNQCTYCVCISEIYNLTIVRRVSQAALEKVKKFKQSKPTEAAGALAIGSFALILMISFFSVIVALDLQRLVRDTRNMFCRNLRDRFLRCINRQVA